MKFDYYELKLYLNNFDMKLIDERKKCTNKLKA